MKELISSELTIRGCTNTLQVGQQFGSFKALADYGVEWSWSGVELEWRRGLKIYDK